jgi:TnpA family transposase
LGKGKEGKKRGEKREKKRGKKEDLARKLRLLTNSHVNFRYGEG